MTQTTLVTPTSTFPFKNTKSQLCVVKNILVASWYFEARPRVVLLPSHCSLVASLYNTANQVGPVNRVALSQHKRRDHTIVRSGDNHFLGNRVSGGTENNTGKLGILEWK